MQFHKDVLEKKFGIYTQHAGIEIVNRDGRPYVYVGYHSKNGAKKAAQELNNFKFMGKKLQARVEEVDKSDGSEKGNTLSIISLESGQWCFSSCSKRTNRQRP